MKKQIIIVDDKIAIANIIMTYLSERYDFEHFANPLPCIEKLKENYLPDLIISDTNMPYMDGEAFLDYLKGDERFKDIPVVILSNADNIEKQAVFIEKGARDYIVKPFNPIELEVRINRVLE